MLDAIILSSIFCICSFLLLQNPAVVADVVLLGKGFLSGISACSAVLVALQPRETKRAVTMRQADAAVQVDSSNSVMAAHLHRLSQVASASWKQDLRVALAVSRMAAAQTAPLRIRKPARAGAPAFCSLALSLSASLHS